MSVLAGLLGTLGAQWYARRSDRGTRMALLGETGSVGSVLGLWRRRCEAAATASLTAAGEGPPPPPGYSPSPER